MSTRYASTDVADPDGDRRSLLRELEAAQDELRQVDRRRWPINEMILRQLRERRPDHEYLTANLELAHVHMVGRDVAAQALIGTIDAPRPRSAEAATARDRMAQVLDEYAWHLSSLESTIRLVSDRRDAARRPETSRPRLLAASLPGDGLQPGVQASARPPTGRR